MNTKAWIYSLITYAVLCVALFWLFDEVWPEHKVLSKVVPLIAGALITQLVRKAFDFILELYNKKEVALYIGVSIKVDHVSRRFTGYGASEGKIVHAGNFKANYEVEAELTVTIQNESPDTLYQLEVSFTPNQYSQKYTLIDSRENKLQPLEGNKHFNFTLRIMNNYYDVYHQDVDKDIQKIYKVGKDISLLNGSKINIKYLDSKHKAHLKIEIFK